MLLYCMHLSTLTYCYMKPYLCCPAPTLHGRPSLTYTLLYLRLSVSLGSNGQALTPHDVATPPSAATAPNMSTTAQRR